MEKVTLYMPPVIELVSFQNEAPVLTGSTLSVPGMSPGEFTPGEDLF